MRACVCVHICLLIDMMVLVLVCWQVIHCYICLAVGCLKQPFGLTSGQLKVNIMHTPAHWFSACEAILLLIFTDCSIRVFSYRAIW